MDTDTVSTHTSPDGPDATKPPENLVNPAETSAAEPNDDPMTEETYDLEALDALYEASLKHISEGLN